MIRSILCRTAIAFACCLAAKTLAVQFTPLSIEELTAKAAIIIHGKVSGKSCAQDETGRIYTKVELEVFDVLKGQAKSNPFLIVHGGGTVGDKTAVVVGQADYSVGEEVVAFLVLNQRGEGVTVGLAQGQFHVWPETANGVKLARNLFHGIIPGASQAVQKQSAALSTRLTLDGLKQRVIGAAR